MLNILHIIPNLKKGGAERLILDIISGLKEKDNVVVKLILFSCYNEYCEKSKEIDFEIIETNFVPSLTKKPKRNIADLQSFIDNFKPDIIHTHLWETEIALSQLKIGKAIRFSHFHDNMLQLRKTILPLKKVDITDFFERKTFLTNILYNQHHFICISNHTYSYAKKVLPKYLNSNIHLLSNAINFEDFYSENSKQKDKLRLINIGSFVPKKNQKFAVDIFSKIIEAGIVAELTFLGNGPLIKDVKRHAEQLNLSDHINFAGNVNNVSSYLKSSNMYLHTAYYEPFGLVLLEAMAASLPVVSLDGGGNRDIIIDEVNGYIIKQENPDTFVDVILNLWKEVSTYDKIVKEGLQTAKENDIKVYTNKLLETYRESMSSTK